MTSDSSFRLRETNRNESKLIFSFVNTHGGVESANMSAQRSPTLGSVTLDPPMTSKSCTSVIKLIWISRWHDYKSKAEWQ